MAKIEIELPGGAKAGQTLQELQKEASKLNREISKLPIGSQEFVEKSKRLKEVNTSLTEVRNQVRGTTQASNELKSVWSNFLPFVGQFQAIGDKILGTGKNVGGLARSFTTLRGAIISTGIGALIVLLGSLISYFTTTQEGIDKVTSVTRPLAAVFETLKGILQELGQKVFKQIAEAIDNPKQALIDLGNVIVNNVMNRFKALSLFGPALKKLFSKDWKEGLKDLGNAVLQATTGVENAIDKIVDAGKAMGKVFDEAWQKGKRLDELQKQIERAEINQIKRGKELELIIKEQKSIVEDQTKSYDERTAAAKKALEAEETLLNSELSLLDKKIEKMRLEQTLNDTGRDQEKELAELEAKRLELQAKSTEQRIAFRNKINEFEKAKAAEEAALLKKRQEELQALEDAQLEIKAASREKDLEMLKRDLVRQIEALDQSSPYYAERVAAMQALARQRRDEINKEWDAKEREEALAKLDLDTTTELNVLNEKWLNNQLAEEEYLVRAEQMAINHQARRLEIIKAAHGEESAEYQKEYATYLSLQQAASDRAVEIKAKEMEEQKALQEAALGTFGSFFGSLASMQKEGTAQWKTYAIAQATIASIQSALNAYQSTSAIPVIGPALAPVAAGLALAAGYERVREIQRTKIEAPKPIGTPKAEKGMVLRGPSHANGGIPIEAEGDEIILTKGVYRNPALRRVASMINVLGGGRQFEAGGPVNPLASGGGTAALPSRQMNTGAEALFGNQQEVVNELRSIRETVEAWPSRLKVVNVATDTEAVLDEVIRIRNEADV